jgi:tRNA-dihydrouridine synthase
MGENCSSCYIKKNYLLWSIAIMKSILKLAITTQLAIAYLLFPTIPKNIDTAVDAQAVTLPNHHLIAQQVDLQEVQRMIQENPEILQQAQQLLQQNPELVQQLIEQTLQQYPDLIQQIQQNPQLIQQVAQQGQGLLQLLQQNPQLLQQLQQSIQPATQK